MIIYPIFYSFLGCPFCLRAHMALKYAEQKIILRKVELSNLPAEALAVSAHATVPSLVINEHEYLDESWDIVKWAVQQHDPENWLGNENEYLQDAEMLVETNDYSFREDLKKYKNPDDYPEYPVEYYQLRGAEFLEELDEMLGENQFLLASHITIADIAVFPLVREFAMVDKAWFDKTPYSKVQSWLTHIIETDWFQDAMQKHEIWQSGNEDIYI